MNWSQIGVNCSRNTDGDTSLESSSRVLNRIKVTNVKAVACREDWSGRISFAITTKQWRRQCSSISNFDSSAAATVLTENVQLTDEIKLDCVTARSDNNPLTFRIGWRRRRPVWRLDRNFAYIVVECQTTTATRSHFFKSQLESLNRVEMLSAYKQTSFI